MSQPGKLGKYLVIFLLLALIGLLALTFLFGSKIGNTFSTISNCLPDVGQSCVITPTLGDVFGTEFPSSTEESSSSSPIEEQLEQVDQVLRQSVQSSIAYNIPASMTLDETVTLELLLNPSVSPTQLAGQINENGEIITATIDITPMMKAELIPQDAEALTVQPLHADAVQLVGSADTTRWSWLVTARKGGTQKLVLVIHRLVKFDGQEFWREVTSYQSEINVNVTLTQRIQSTGWAGLASVLLLLLLAGAFFRRRPGKDQRMLEAATSKRTGRTGHIFISYRRSDSADIVGRIYDRLVEEFGRSHIFKDVDSIPLGSDFKQTLNLKVSECNVLLAIIGDRWTGAEAGRSRLDDPQDFVRLEVESALERGIPVIPLLVRGAQMPLAESLPSGLQPMVYKNGIPIRPDPDFHRDMDRLISALDQYLR